MKRLVYYLIGLRSALSSMDLEHEDQGQNGDCAASSDTSLSICKEPDKLVFIRGHDEERNTCTFSFERDPDLTKKFDTLYDLAKGCPDPFPSPDAPKCLSSFESDKEVIPFDVSIKSSG